MLASHPESGSATGDAPTPSSSLSTPNSATLHASTSPCHATWAPWFSSVPNFRRTAAFSRQWASFLHAFNLVEQKYSTHLYRVLIRFGVMSKVLGMQSFKTSLRSCTQGQRHHWKMPPGHWLCKTDTGESSPAVHRGRTEWSKGIGGRTYLQSPLCWASNY